jgi:hypothetical protein
MDADGHFDVPVHGIELSRAMVAKLREKPGGEAIGVTIGDMADTTVDGSFSVAYLQRLPPGDTFRVFHVSESHWGLDEYDVANQGLVSHHFEAVGGAIEKTSGPFRYVWPSELDLMAQLAGMTLRERWSGWRREPFTSASRQHVSVWQRR